MKFLPNQPVSTGGERVKYIRKSLAISQKKLADVMGVSQSTLSQIENGHYNVTFESLKNISEEYNINCNWLVLGVEEIFLPDAKEKRDFSVAKKFEKPDRLKKKKEDKDDGIPFVDAEAIAGYIENYDSDNFLDTLGVYHLPGYEENENRRIFQVDGESMEPSLCDKDYLICEFCEEKKSIKNGDIMVVISEDAVLVKRLYFHEKDESFYVLQSDNPDFNSLIMPIAKINELWCVIGRLTTELAPPTRQGNKLSMTKIENEMAELKKKVDMLMKLNGK